MSSSTRAIAIAATIAVAGFLLYLPKLDVVPPYLIHDEAQGALQAHAIATTAHDLSGRFLPLYFTEPEFPPGRDPALIYVTALGLKVLPFTEAGARTPTALVAVIDIVLMFFAARALFQSTWAGVLAAILLALTPIHFIRGRLLLSPLYSIPFVLAWLWSLGRFDQQPSARRLFAACAWLAAGMYSYLAAVVMMPLYLLMTLGIAMRPLRWRSLLVAVAVFAVILLPMAAWYVTHPERNAEIVSAYNLSSGGGGSSLAAVTTTVGRRLNLYWLFFDPSYLFVSGDASLINSTREAGLFPLAFAILLPIGAFALIRSTRPISWVLAAGLLTAPIVSVISGAIEMNRVMFAIPFAVLVATSGARALSQSPRLAIRALAVVLVASIAWQFAGFYRGYMSERYRMSAASWFSGSVREALRALLAQAGDSDIYVSTEIDWAHRFWRFYAIEAGRLDLVARTAFVAEPPRSARAGSKLICPAESAPCAAAAGSGLWRRVETVASFNGVDRFTIFERTLAPADDRR